MSLSRATLRWLDKNGPASLEGRRVLVTGANSGVGFKTAEVAIHLGAAVVLACRNLQRAAGAKAALLKEYPGAVIDLMTLDLADLASVAAFAARLEEEKVDLDVFVNNAGVFHLPGQKTADGFDRVMGTNYLGVYALSEAVLPYLATLPHGVTYVNTVSLIHKFAKVDDSPLDGKKLGNVAAYADSKLCLARYTYALAARYKDTNVRVVMCHPGIAITPLGLKAVGPIAKLEPVLGWLFQSPEKASLSVPYLLAHERPAGSITGPTKLLGGWGYPKPNKVSRKVTGDASALIQATENARKNGTS
ncbi:MAG: SDR family NAD(P)-dependent oxidoreductase [Clostridia bacterium]|nr:SDR family NAD(P)-dependent oxidoreductase [Clostridia bacterium]